MLVEKFVYLGKVTLPACEHKYRYNTETKKIESNCDEVSQEWKEDFEGYEFETLKDAQQAVCSLLMRYALHYFGG